MKIQISYKVRENDNSWMSSRDLENENHSLEVTKKEEIINFLKSLEYVTVHKDIMNDLESKDIEFNEELDELFSEDETDQWIHTEFVLRIKALK